MSAHVGIVVPAFRPDPELLERYVDALREHVDPAVVRVELDDPDPDLRDRLAQRVGSPADVDLNVVPSRRGKGAAITAGFETLVDRDDVDVLAFADADGSTPARSVDRVVDPVRTGAADLVVGSRRHPDADVRSHQTVARRYLGDGFAWTARRLLDVELTDYQCGAKALSTAAWRDVREHLYEPGFAWDVELVAVADAVGHRVTERPVVWKDRPGSTVDPIPAALRMGRGLFAARHRAGLLRDAPLHTALESPRDDPPALVDRAVADD
jgi:glycosyltransferase involved in cell wall biosynthesis